jgi:hypothetical protein
MNTAGNHRAESSNADEKVIGYSQKDGTRALIVENVVNMKIER